MKTILLCVVVALLGFVTTQAQRQDEQVGVHWETDLAKATEIAGETGRPLMIVFR